MSAKLPERHPRATRLGRVRHTPAPLHVDPQHILPSRCSAVWKKAVLGSLWNVIKKLLSDRYILPHKSEICTKYQGMISQQLHFSWAGERYRVRGETVCLQECWKWLISVVFWSSGQTVISDRASWSCSLDWQRRSSSAARTEASSLVGLDLLQSFHQLPLLSHGPALGRSALCYQICQFWKQVSSTLHASVSSYLK